MDDKFFGRDIVFIEDFSREELDYIISLAEEVKRKPETFLKSMQDKIMVPMFFEDSTRTNLSFQLAMLQMDGRVADFDREGSSLKKGESLGDTLRIVNGYKPDVVVMRHKRDGATQFAADILDMPLLSAGDGKNQHPTQTMLDLFSIREAYGRIDGVKIAFAGDLKYGRTVHSLASALSSYSGCEICFVSPDSLRFPENLSNQLKARGCECREFGLDKLPNICKEADVLYMTRIQRERFPEGAEGNEEYERIKRDYCLRSDMLRGVKKDFKIMHPLPKVFEIAPEIAPEIDSSEYAYYYQQAENGLYVRKALLQLVLGGKNAE